MKLNEVNQIRWKMLSDAVMLLGGMWITSFTFSK